MSPTVRQRRILQWLDKINPHGARMFETALRVRGNAALPCRSRLVAHALREVCSCLENLNGQTSRVTLDALAEKLVQAAITCGFSFESSPTSGADPKPKGRDPIPIPWKVAGAVRELIGAHTARPKGTMRAQALLDRLHGRQQTPTAEVTPTATRWHRMAQTFTRCCHDRLSADSELFSELDAEVEFLEEMLSSFTQGAVENLSALDEILAKANA